MTPFPSSIIRSAVLLSVILMTVIGYAQDSENIIQAYLNAHQEELGIQESDYAEWSVSHSYFSESTKVTHVHIKQMVNGLEIENGTANFNLLDGKVFSMGDRMVRDIYSKANSPQPILGPEEAIVRAAKQLNIAIQGSIKVLETMSPTEFLYDKGNFSLEDVPVQLVYHSTGE
ncbi:MAG: hypothetical protein HKN79_01655 [Flavobacteriales bacterium]|nr:hypothetical protein [Flavobacteriales bacterium]